MNMQRMLMLTATLGLLTLASVALAQVKEPPVAPVGTTSHLLQVSLGLAVVLALLGGAAWLLKRFAGPRLQRGNIVKLIGGTAVGTRERVVVVEVHGAWIVVGVAPGQVRALHTLPKPELPAANGPAANPPAPFSAWLGKVMERRNAD